MVEEGFFEVFFGANNLCSLEKMEIVEHQQNKILPWVKRIRGNEPKETIIPVIHPRTKEVTWYGMAFSDRQFRRLGEHIFHFLGSTYSNFTGIRAVPNTNDPIEQLVNRVTNGQFYRFQADNAHIWDALEMMRHLWEEKPETEVQNVRGLSRMLRDFHLALQIGDQQIAKRELEQLKQGQVLESRNLLYLEVEMLEAFGKWQDILDLKLFPDLINMRRPPAVTEAMLKAVYHVHLQPVSDDLDKLFANFNENVFKRYQNLFLIRRNFSSREALTSYLLRAVTADPVKSAWIEAIFRELNPDDEFTAFLRKITAKVELVEPVVEPVTIHLVEQKVIEGNYTDALELLKQLPETFQKTRYLFDCAYELQTLEAEGLALKSYQSLTGQDQEQFLKSRRNKEALAKLTVQSAEENQAVVYEIPSNWFTWLDLLGRHSHRDNVQMAQKGAQEWSVADILTDDDGVWKLKEKLEASFNDPFTLQNLYYSYPHLLEFFKTDEAWPRKEFKPIYLTLMEILTLAEEISDLELSIFQDLLIAVLNIGLSKSEYEDVVKETTDLWNTAASYKNLSWAIDVMESFIQYPCSNEDLRVHFMKEIDRRLHVFARFMRDSDWEFIRLLHMDLKEYAEWKGLEATYLSAHEAVLEETKDLWEKLEGKSLGIYTLMEGASHRVKAFLEKKVERIEITTNHDKAGTESLKMMARTVDILLVATASSKHAATIFIQNERPTYLATIPCHAKGSSSMLRLLENYLEKL